MRIFWVVLMVTSFLCSIAKQHPSQYIDKFNNKYIKPNKKIFMLVAFILIAVSGLRSGVGDTGTYKHIFSTLPSSISEYMNFDAINEDRGFYFLVVLIKQFISTDNQVIIFILSFITISLICYGLYKYSDDITLAVFLFITMGCFGTSMNGVRQYVAAAILFSALPLIEKRKLIPYFILVYLTSTIHASAIIFLPIYFLNRCKGWGMVSYGIMFVGLLLFVTYNTTGPMIVELLGESQYGHYADALLSDNEGANLIRVAIAFVPVALSWLGKDKINREMKCGNIIINMNIINFVVMLLATRHWIYARFCIYFNLYSIIILCYCIDHLFERRSAKVVKTLCVLCYLVFFWYDSLTSGLHYSSDIIKF